LYSIGYNSLLNPIKEAKVKEDVKQAFLAYLFFINSNDTKHSQLKKTVANDHAKGDGGAFPSSCHAALMLMNDFKPLIIKGTAPVAAQGTAFSQKRKELEHWLPAPIAPIIRNTLLTRNSTPVVRRGTHQDVALRRRQG
jgi:hypothetical protein